MPQDTLPGVLDLPSRDDIVQDYKKDVAFFGPAGMSTEEGTLPDIDANTFATQQLPIWANIRKAGNNLVLTEAQGAATEAWATSKGLVGRIPAVGASGSVKAGAGFAVGGSHIFVDDELTYKGTRYNVTSEKVYYQGDTIPVLAKKDLGVGTNQLAGTVLTWTSPRPGCEPTSAVWADTLGRGLIGGRDAEGDGEIVSRIIQAGKTPAASGNSFDYIKAIESTAGYPIQKGFAYPALFGPGTTGVAFTVKPDYPGGGRAPTTAQIAAVALQIAGIFPSDDGVFTMSLLGSPVALAFRVDWLNPTTGWIDAQPWPTSASPALVTGGTPLTVQVNCTTLPIPGQTIAFLDPVGHTFIRKRVLSITGAIPNFILNVDPTVGASDTTTSPTVGTNVSPWSDSLASLLPVVLGYFDTLGPGEVFANIFDPGLRRRRAPKSPYDWPSSITNRLAYSVQAIPAVFDAQLTSPAPAAIPFACPVGVPGVLARLLTVGDIAVYPLS